METKTIELKKLNRLQEMINFLGDYKGTTFSSVEINGEVTIDGVPNKELSDLLNEMGQLNKRRNEILLTFLNYK